MNLLRTLLASPSVLLRPLQDFLLALQFFTRIPVTGRVAQWAGYSPARLRSSAAHFPGVGWLVGGLAAGITWLLLGYLPGGRGLSAGAAMGVAASASWGACLVAAVLGTAASVWVTGAFHEDGLADVADGLGGSPERERALVIMKDSRVGAFGVLAIVLMLLAKVSLLALVGSVNPIALCWGLFAAHVVSRGLPLVLIRALPHVGNDATSKSKPLADSISNTSLCIALAWTLGAFWLAGSALGGIPLAWPLLGSTMALLWLWRLFWRRLQGFTGDCLGATQQLCEVAFYLGLTLSL